MESAPGTLNLLLDDPTALDFKLLEVILVSHGSLTSYMPPNITNIRTSTRPIGPTEKPAIRVTKVFENLEE